MSEPIQLRVLQAALAHCHRHGGWSFDVSDIVDALPDLNPQSVRTHVTSRCCLNAPPNHSHRWPYFKRVSRGRYEVAPAFRRHEAGQPARVREAKAVYAPVESTRSVLHAAVTQSDGWYVGELLELPIVTQAKTLDALVQNVGEAVAFYLADEDREALGLAGDLRVAVSYEMTVR
ncbi:MAG TPA: hypothetical protein VFZ36_01830 [Vicinamibacterales bacterium]